MIDKLANGELDLVLGLSSKATQEAHSRIIIHDQLCFVVSQSHRWHIEPESVTDTLGEQQYLQYAKGTETNRLVQTWIEHEAKAKRTPIVLGDMKAICEMARMGIGVGIVAPWVALREMEEGGMHAITIPGAGITREWAAFYSPRKSPTIVEETFIGLCELGFQNLKCCSHLH